MAVTWEFVEAEFSRLTALAGLKSHLGDCEGSPTPGMVYLLDKRPAIAGHSEHSSDSGPAACWGQIPGTAGGAYAIAIPRGDLFGYTAEDVSFVLAHEVGHIVNGDLLPAAVQYVREGGAEAYAAVEARADAYAAALCGHDRGVEVQAVAAYVMALKGLAEAVAKGRKPIKPAHFATAFAVRTDRGFKLRFGERTGFAAEAVASAAVRAFEEFTLTM